MTTKMAHLRSQTRQIDLLPALALNPNAPHYLCRMNQMQPDALTVATPRATWPRLGLVWAALATLSAMMLLNVMAFGVEMKTVSATLPGILLFLGCVALLWAQMPRHYPHGRFGGCNTVTLFRTGLGATLVTPLVTGAIDPMTGWAIVIVAIVALSLDGVDGWLARRSGLSSAFGARFDMEVDAALALILCLHALADGLVGSVVLVLGVMRYLFIAASWVLPWMAAALPDRFGRKVVCVIQIAALIALQVPVLTQTPAQIIAFGAALALVWSFGRDTLWLWRHR